MGVTCRGQGWRELVFDKFLVVSDYHFFTALRRYKDINAVRQLGQLRLRAIGTHTDALQVVHVEFGQLRRVIGHDVFHAVEFLDDDFHWRGDAVAVCQEGYAALGHTGNHAVRGCRGNLIVEAVPLDVRGGGRCRGNGSRYKDRLSAVYRDFLVLDDNLERKFLDVLELAPSGSGLIGVHAALRDIQRGIRVRFAAEGGSADARRCCCVAVYLEEVLIVDEGLVGDRCCIFADIQRPKLRRDTAS